MIDITLKIVYFFVKKFGISVRNSLSKKTDLLTDKFIVNVKRKLLVFRICSPYRPYFP